MQIRNTILALACLCATAGLTAQCMQMPMSDSEKEALAEFVFTGTILDREYIFNQEDGHIYTLYLTAVDGILKNTLPQLVQIAERGGRWGNLTEQVTPSLQVNTGDTGMFFANRATTQWKDFDSGLPVLRPTFGALSFKNIPASPPAGPDAIPVITSVAPDTLAAGSGDVIVIKGTGFGSGPTGFALLQLRNPDIVVGAIAYQSVLFKHILSRSDSEIRLRAPGRDVLLNTAGAGSGAVRVINPMGLSATSTQQIAVKYNRFVQGFSATTLAGPDGQGGYQLSLHTGLFNIPEARAALERAIQNWKCTVHSNIAMADTPVASQCPANDGINLVAFDDACPLPPGMLAQTTQWFETCNDGSMRLLEMDLMLDNNVSWFYGPGAVPGDQFDLESLALHELGHVHGLGHTLDSLAVMYPALTPGASRRTFDAGTREGADEIIAESAGAGACGNLPNFVPAPDCEVTATNALPGQSFGIYPNPATDKLWIALPEHIAGSISVSLRSMTGEIVSDQNVESGKISRSFSVDLSGLAPGIYFLTIYSGGERFSSKLIKM